MVKARIIQGLVKQIEVYTILDDNKKRGNRAVVSYRLGHGIELSLSRDSQLQTTIISIESTWDFQAFSRIGGHRIKWQ